MRASESEIKFFKSELQPLPPCPSFERVQGCQSSPIQMVSKQIIAERFEENFVREREIIIKKVKTKRAEIKDY